MHLNIHTKRVILIIDRRGITRDKLYCFIPPKPFNNTTHLYLSSQLNTTQFLLPNSQNNHKIINALSNCNGYMFCLSFYISEIKEKAREKETNTKDKTF